jgi:hypothetical protein
MVSEAAGAVVRHMHDGLVHAVGDQAALTGQFRQLLAEPGLLKRLRDASLAEVAGLTWKGAVADLVREYRRCLADSCAATTAPPPAAVPAPV